MVAADRQTLCFPEMPTLRCSETSGILSSLTALHARLLVALAVILGVAGNVPSQSPELLEDKLCLTLCDFA